jgi:predicted ribosome quality control (RQC) complex YloA/Tae2 family protein
MLLKFNFYSFNLLLHVKTNFFRETNIISSLERRGKIYLPKFSEENDFFSTFADYLDFF